MLYLITSLSHILYFYVWDFTDHFISVSIIQKILQIIYIIIYSIQNNTLLIYIEEFNIINFILILLGQTLNISVYYRLGIKGVYYGSKLGFMLPYITTFPYNIGIHNPQYIGCMLTFFGLYPLLSPRYILYTSSLYYISGYIENE